MSKSKVFTITDGLENMGALRTGGQGSIYKGRRIGPIITAVKLLPTPVGSESEDDKNYRNFISEVNKLKKVNEIPNPNVVKILNFGITDSGSFPFIEMEFIEGPDLCELISAPNDKIFTLKQLFKLADQLACALAHCHKVGVKHGDVKSNNVKFNNDTGNYVLLDFGLSILSEEERRSSIRHAGAIEFMAPEQNEGKMLPQTDIYSYGVILFELLTGRVPFPLTDNGETSRNTVMVAHMESPIPNILELRKQNLPPDWSPAEGNIPQWLLRLVYKCLEKNPEDRYADGIELHDAILQVSLGGSQLTEPQNSDQPVDYNLSQDNIPTSTNLISDTDTLQKNDLISMSKPVFAIIMLMLLGFMCYTGYSLFKQPEPPPEVVVAPAIDSLNRSDSVQVIKEPDYAFRERKRLRDSVIKSTINEELEKARQQNADESDTTEVDTTEAEATN